MESNATRRGETGKIVESLRERASETQRSLIAGKFVFLFYYWLSLLGYFIAYHNWSKWAIAVIATLITQWGSDEWAEKNTRHTECARWKRDGLRHAWKQAGKSNVHKRVCDCKCLSLSLSLCVRECDMWRRSLITHSVERMVTFNGTLIRQRRMQIGS